MITAGKSLNLQDNYLNQLREGQNPCGYLSY